MREKDKKEGFARRPGWAKGNSLPLHGNFPDDKTCRNPLGTGPTLSGPLLWPRVASVKTAVFHGEKLASTGPQNTCRYPLSFFELGTLRSRNYRTCIRAGGAS